MSTEKLPRKARRENREVSKKVREKKKKTFQAKKYITNKEAWDSNSTSESLLISNVT